MNSHEKPSCTGILLSNLGTPDAADTRSVRRYLAEFLSDPRVIEVPRPIWWLILHGIILRIRPARSAKAYRKVWTEEGSPLLAISRRQAAALQAQLDGEGEPGCLRVELGMRYGRPSIASALEKLRQANAQRILVLPLYPQYSAATTATAFDAVADTLRTWRALPELRMVSHYHDHHGYIHALAESVKTHQARHGKPERLIFSFHGLPEHYFLAGDPYHCECHKTARLVAEALQLEKDDWQVTFQSRFGPRRWLQPYTDMTLKALAVQGVGHLQVICPGFSVDCLETLEEIDMQNRAFFLEAGGKTFSYIPALNDSAAHIDALRQIVGAHTQGWRHTEIPDELSQRVRRAQDLESAQRQV
ncbi:MAG: ferrochelatase [Candidatus Eutrophobiaceae bacterium]